MLRLLLLMLPALIACSSPSMTTDRLPTEVYLLIGQSNMAGRAKLDAAHPTPRILAWTELGWAIAKDPLHHDNTSAGVGPGVSFASTLLEANPSATVGLIPAAVGGTSIAQWQKGGALYADAIRLARHAMQDGTLKGVLWHQGEQDAYLKTEPAIYEAGLTQLLTDLHTDLGVPVVLGEIYGSPINASIHKVADTLHLPVASSASLTVFDQFHHFDTASQRELGRRYAAALLR